MKRTITVFFKDYDCHVVEQPGRAKGTRYKAYGHFEGKYLDAQGPSEDSALKKLKRIAEIFLDY